MDLLTGGLLSAAATLMALRVVWQARRAEKRHERARKRYYALTDRYAERDENWRWPK